MTVSSYFRKIYERRRLLRWITPDEFKNPDKYFFARFTEICPSTRGWYWSADAVHIAFGSTGVIYTGVRYSSMSGRFKLAVNCEPRKDIKIKRLIRKIKRRQPRRFKGEIPSGAAYKKIKIKRPLIG